MGGKTTYRTLSPKMTHFQTGIDRWPHLRKVPRRWISHTYPMWLWGHSLFKISSPGPVFYGTKWLLWRPYEQSPTFHSKCRINKGVIKRGSKIDHWRSRCKGRILWSTPYAFIRSFIHFIIGNKGLGRPGYDLKSNIKTDLEEIVCEGLGLIQLAHDRSSGGFLWIRNLIIGLRKGVQFFIIWSIVWQEGLCSMTVEGARISFVKCFPKKEHQPRGYLRRKPFLSFAVYF
jgi:hypothetical protein